MSESCTSRPDVRPHADAGELISAEGAQYETVREDKSWQATAYQVAKAAAEQAAPAIKAH